MSELIAVSSSSNVASGAMTAASALREARPPVPTRRRVVRSGWAKKSPWNFVKPSSRASGELLGRRDLGGDELEVARAQRVEVVVAGARERDLDHVADLKQRGLDAVECQRVAAELQPPQRGQHLVGHRAQR